MQENTTPLGIVYTSPKFLGFFMLAYSALVVLINGFYTHFIHILGTNMDAGILAFPLTFLLLNCITEIYGYKHARRAIWYGFLFNGLLILYGQLIIQLPAPNYYSHNALFNSLLTIPKEIIFGSLIAYLMTEPLSAFILAKLKIQWQGEHVISRFFISILLAMSVSTVIFSLFLGSISISMWIIWSTAMSGLPFLIYLVQKVKRIERLDIYDIQTHFTIFSLEDGYPMSHNQFGK